MGHQHSSGPKVCPVCLQPLCGIRALVLHQADFDHYTDEERAQAKRVVQQMFGDA